jgi:3-mercaptopyruvate sulfurtransferase SseA
MKRLGALALFALASSACVVWPAGSGPGAAPMPLAEALDLRDGGRAVLIDVRSPQAYARGHIPGALNIAAHELEARAAELRKMSRLSILYCG